ncbi:DUF4123 domain-containing protein [Ralstonia mannitolilytica]|uniref:DUF4123 domain-containing protein n=1 Tax=Ralstonia mannitolilytica TaxID=105219 RepID=A0AAJ4ZPP8_9RALS|nr:DUF4123 domain-containing protein [Ralstonia mannitolilytica]CAG2133139.1 hypothetical protein LMG6866_01100 [Ralstonia mannitolilytica]SUE24149.1 Uncharacterised protein [Ralstonia mannitolilytica]SUE25960.1 Uncharacterised protein [Ralstonia mannitolilytica]SUE35770.1 Uncharacterised protein [Ralstonia mannitolilytica]
MTHRTLADLETSLFAADSTDTDVPHPDALARCRELAARYHALKRQQRPGSHPLRAYLLLDAWESNPLADAISDAWPEAATLRVAVPDDFYTGRENEAPCVVPLPDSALPDGATNSLEQELSRDALARLVMTAGGQAHQRLVRQGLGAVLFSADSAARLAQHLGMLGFQYPPEGRNAKVFRYQDPRVLQRVWPELTAAQQAMWLGPVEGWWSLTQPWGPWALEEMVSTQDAVVSVPLWFEAELSREPDRGTEGAVLNRLMDAKQWRAAHSAPVGNRVWARFAENGVTPSEQPNANLMRQLLSIGTAHHLDGGNLEDFVWCSIRYREAPPSIDWDTPHWSRVLNQTLEALSADPEARFVSAFDACLNPGDETHGLHQPV